MKASELDLVGYAATGASSLEEQFPDLVVFTSGRRSVESQADAMAGNIVRAGRDWIASTYKSSVASRACIKWLADNPKATTRQEIYNGLMQVFNSLGDDVRYISKHLSGEAFDVKPVEGDDGDKIQDAINALSGLERFLTKEGGLTIWHAQFLSEPATRAAAGYRSRPLINTRLASFQPTRNGPKSIG